MAHISRTDLMELVRKLKNIEHLDAPYHINICLAALDDSDKYWFEVDDTRHFVDKHIYPDDLAD
jgi:hypothetical protein